MMRPPRTPLKRLLDAVDELVNEQVPLDWKFPRSDKAIVASAQDDMDELELAMKAYLRDTEMHAAALPAAGHERAPDAPAGPAGAARYPSEPNFGSREVTPGKDAEG